MKMNKEQVKELLFEAFLKAHQYFSEQDDAVDEPTQPDEPVTPEPDPEEPEEPETNPNLFDLSTVSVDKMLNSNGAVIDATGRAISDWIAVDADTYTVSGISKEFNSFDNIIFYNENKRFIERVPTSTLWGRSPNTITVPVGSKYMRLNMYNGDFLSGERMINKGSAQSPYQEYRSGGTPDVKPEPQPETPQRLVVKVEDFANPQAAVDYLATQGGGRVTFNKKDTAGNIKVTTPNIELYSNVEGAILRNVTSSNTVSVERGGVGFILDGLDVRGQTYAEEAMGLVTPDNRIVNTSALHAIAIYEKDATLRNLKASRAAVDSLYVRYDGEVNLTVDNFEFGTTSRNPCTWVSGSKGRLTNGTVYLDNSYGSKRDAGAYYHGLYLWDFEPNGPNQKWFDVTFEDVKFINAGMLHGNNALIVQHRTDAERYDFGLTLNKCEFLQVGEALNTYVRIKLNGKKEFSGVNLIGTKHYTRPIMIAERSEIVMYDSLIKDVELLAGVNSLSWLVKMDSSVQIDNLRHVNGKPVTVSR